MQIIISESLRQGHSIMVFSTKDQTSEFILSPKCPLFGGSTVLYTVYEYVDVLVQDFMQCHVV